MRRTALLVGAQTFGLSGVHADVEAMAERLERRGFEVRCRIGADAARDAVLDALERLVRDAREPDAVVVYFSGHGGLVTAPPALVQGRTPVPRLQFLVPTDHDPASGEFRGITAAELSVLLARLTRTTPNVATVLDTCHAANMVRDDGVRVKALPRLAYLDVAEHLDRLGPDLSLLHLLGNPRVIRLAACRRDQAAYEYTGAGGRRVGVFTEALTRELDEVGDDRITWADLVRRVRARMRAAGWEQRPEAEGPVGRLLFRSRSRPGHGEEDTPIPVRCDLGAAVVVEWGQVVDGVPRRLPATGAEVHDGAHLYVRVRNTGPATVYAAVVELPAGGRASLVSTLDSSGATVHPGEWYAVGHDELTGRWTGFPLARDLRGRPRTVTFAVVVSSAPRDLPPPGRHHREVRPAKRPVLSDVHPFEVKLLPATGRPDPT
ncbi:hypothetical protein Cs7R123_62990 [Catellatospora sp. TT07R-123]|uniref:caspase family protein n=1 Tax=Catellatospora sp. TT07R-123 TaxID=2733863 RepID=UPI001B2930C0|nr:caspase family protein [Catellatospora sp. TT07R-123]GHJ48957.1 hypothetical protein Cs7R123_62990 [Catellatospora sp. TT07R-123]